MVVLLTEILTRMLWPNRVWLCSCCYQKSLSNRDWISKLAKCHWGKDLVLWMVVCFVTVFPEKEQRWHSWKMVRRRPETWWESQVLEGSRYCRQIWMAGVWVGFCALKCRFRLNLNIPSVSSTKEDLKILCGQLLLLCLCKWMGKN